MIVTSVSMSNQSSCRVENRHISVWTDCPATITMHCTVNEEKIREHTKFSPRNTVTCTKSRAGEYSGRMVVGLVSVKFICMFCSSSWSACLILYQSFIGSFDQILWAKESFQQRTRQERKSLHSVSKT